MAAVTVEPDDSTASAFGLFKTAEETTVLHLHFPYNVNAALTTSTLVATGVVTTDTASHIVCSTGVAANGSAVLTSKDAVKYTPGQGVNVRFTAVFAAPRLNSVQIVGLIDATDGFAVGYLGTTFGVLHRNNGVDTWYPRERWTQGKAGWLIPQLGNVFGISFQWLGYGFIRFYVEDPITGTRMLVHEIRYPNSATVPSLNNPTLPFRIEATNTGNTTNLALAVASIGAVVEGPVDVYGLLGSTQNRKTGIGVLTNIVSIQNKTSYASKTNKVRVKLMGLSFASNADANIGLFLAPTVGGAPSFIDFDAGTSVVAVDTAGTTVTGGRRIFAAVAENSAASYINLDPLNYRMNPGDIIVCAAASVAGTTAISVAPTWREEF